MKRLFCLMLALALLALGAFAPAEEPAWEGGYSIHETAQSIDLDGDGSQETIWLETVPDDFESFQRLHVTGADGAEVTYDCGIISGPMAWAGDINGDGSLEIFLWGDIMSDDYYTWCLHYRGDRLSPTLFADINRGENTRGYYKDGYGALEGVDMDAGTVTLNGSQDALGTYFLGRTLKLTEDGLFETADDGLWFKDISAEITDPEYLEYAGLTAKTAIPCEIDGQAAVIKPGEKLYVTGTDKVSVVTFLTSDGRAGRLAISEDYERGWGSLVDGIPEEEAFEYLPYAD